MTPVNLLQPYSLQELMWETLHLIVSFTVIQVFLFGNIIHFKFLFYYVRIALDPKPHYELILKPKTGLLFATLDNYASICLLLCLTILQYMIFQPFQWMNSFFLCLFDAFFFQYNLSFKHLIEIFFLVSYSD